MFVAWTASNTWNWKYYAIDGILQMYGFMGWERTICLRILRACQFVKVLKVVGTSIDVALCEMIVDGEFARSFAIADRGRIGKYSAGNSVA